MALRCANPECQHDVPADKRCTAIYCCWQCRDRAGYLRTRAQQIREASDWKLRLLAMRKVS